MFKAEFKSVSVVFKTFKPIKQFDIDTEFHIDWHPLGDK